MIENLRFQVRESQKDLDKLDAALNVLGYKNRADWYRTMKRETISAAKKEKAQG